MPEKRKTACHQRNVTLDTTSREFLSSSTKRKSFALTSPFDTTTRVTISTFNPAVLFTGLTFDRASGPIIIDETNFPNAVNQAWFWICEAGTVNNSVFEELYVD